MDAQPTSPTAIPALTAAFRLAVCIPDTYLLLPRVCCNLAPPAPADVLPSRMPNLLDYEGTFRRYVPEAAHRSDFDRPLAVTAPLLPTPLALATQVDLVLINLRAHYVAVAVECTTGYSWCTACQTFLWCLSLPCCVHYIRMS